MSETEMPDAAPVAGPEPTATLLAEAIGGARGVVDATVPTVAFISVNAAVGLTAALVVAIASSLAMLLLRAIRREPLQQAFSGLVGVMIAAWFARRTHSASGFFLPNIAKNAGYFAIGALSLAARRPLLGYVMAAFDRRYKTWRDDPALRRAATWATVVWMVVFAVRAVVQGVLYLADLPGWLAAANLTLGIPLFVVAILATMTLVRRLAPAALADPPGAGPVIDGDVIAAVIRQPLGAQPLGTQPVGVEPAPPSNSAS